MWANEDIKDEEAEMLMVLVYEHVIHGQRLRMGGRLVKILKSYQNDLKEILESGTNVSVNGKTVDGNANIVSL